MNHLSAEFLWFPITGTVGWSANPVSVSIDDGTTWITATVDQTTISTVTLPNGRSGTHGYARVMSTDLALSAQTTVRFLLRLNASPEIPVIYAGKMFIW